MKHGGFSLLLIVSIFYSCKTTMYDLIPERINIENPSGAVNLSDMFQIAGFTRLRVGDIQGIDRFREASKIVFKDDQVIVFDNVSDFQNIWVFDQKTGSNMLRLDHPFRSREIGDIDLTHDGSLCALVAGKRSFYTYGLDGSLQSTLPNGVIGDGLACLPDGGYLVYNEYSATDISGYNQLLFYDNKGNLLKRSYTYPEALDNYGSGLSGFISKSDNGVWFSPPFCDTVYEIKRVDLTPRYVFDFGALSVPESMRGRRISGWDVHENAYLTETFIKVGHHLVFDYFKDHKMNIGFFNEKSGKFYKFSDASRDHLSDLLKYGRVFSKDQNSFAFYLSAPQLNNLLQKKAIDMTRLEQHDPALYGLLKTIDPLENRDPLVLYLSFKNEPGMN